MITVTSAEAAKILAKLNDERDTMLSQENSLAYFLCASSENPDDNRPDYDMEQYHQQILVLEDKIRRVKHAISLFNVSHKVEGFDLTIDETLVAIPQLNERRRNLRYMAQALPRERKEISNTPVIDYSYANFDPKKAKAEYDAVCDRISKLQLALDKVNQTEKFDIDIEL